MTYNSKKNIVSVAAGFVSVASYIIYVCTVNPPASDDIQAWSKRMLLFIGVSVAVQIIIQILFHAAFAVGVAVKEHDKDGKKTEKIIASSMIEDERDKLINLKASHVGYICAGVGLMIALFALAGGASYVIALHVIVGSFAAGSIIEGIAGIVLNERGVRNGR